MPCFGCILAWASEAGGVSRQRRGALAAMIVSCILNSKFWFCPPQCGLYSFRAQNKVERLGPVDPGVSRESSTFILHYTHPVTRAIEVSHAAGKAEF